MLSRTDAADGEDVITVFGHDLVNSVMGTVTFSEMVFVAMSGGRFPQPGERAVTDVLLTTFTDHGVTPSSLATQLTLLGAPESPQSAIAAGLCGAGSRYLGTLQTSASMLQQTMAELGDAVVPALAAAARALVAERVAARQPIPGLGHPEHKNGDPRSPKLLALAREHGVAGPHCDLLMMVSEAFTEQTGKQLPLNAAGVAGAIVSDMGFEPECARGLAVVARAAGLLGAMMDEIRNPSAQALWDELRDR